MAAISILGMTEQHFKARIGMEIDSTPIEHAFCAHAVQDSSVLVVPDACADERFASNPLVVDAPHIRSYAGAPLQMTDGTRIGALCILDVVPREISERDAELLHLSARTVVGQLELERLITEQSRAIVDLSEHQRELRHRATHDELTHILNRRGLIEEMDARLLADSRRVGRLPGSHWLFFVDLDNFKVINDTLGHERGDEVLAIIAQRLRRQSGARDLVGRIGGDEFVIATRTDDPAAAQSRARSLLDCIADPIVLDDITVQCRASIGMSRDRGDRITAVDMIGEADRAMYAVKQTGGARPARPSERIKAASHLDGRSRAAFVRAILDQQRVAAHYQPIVDLRTRDTIRHEALVRWAGRDDTDPTPAEFIDAAESAGLVHDVGAAVLAQACAFGAALERGEQPGGISVNLSPMQVEPGLDEVLAEALDVSSIPPSLLTIEVTEARALEPIEAVTRVLDDVSALGVRLSLDDFGTGYASVAMLCDLPFDELKIDRRFFADEPRLLQIVAAAVTIGHSFGLEVVAEGIESEAMAERAADLGCDSGQGFHLGHPVPSNRILATPLATASR